MKEEARGELHTYRGLVVLGGAVPRGCAVPLAPL